MWGVSFALVVVMTVSCVAFSGFAYDCVIVGCNCYDVVLLMFVFGCLRGLCWCFVAVLLVWFDALFVFGLWVVWCDCV